MHGALLMASWVGPSSWGNNGVKQTLAHWLYVWKKLVGARPMCEDSLQGIRDLLEIILMLVVQGCLMGGIAGAGGEYLNIQGCCTACWINVAHDHGRG